MAVSRLTDRSPTSPPLSLTSAATPGAHEFPGCRPVHISRDAIADYEGRLEYWDADSETAWVVRAPVSIWHELPGQRLARLTERIAAARGAAIETLGNSDLLLRNEAGERRRILQADQIVYLRQQTIRRLGAAIEIGRDDLPDVILEVESDDRCPPRQAGAVRVLGISRAVGRRAGWPGPQQSSVARGGTDDSRPGPERIRAGSRPAGRSAAGRRRRFIGR